MFLFFVARAGFAVRACALAALSAFVAVKRDASFSQCVEKRKKKASAFSQNVFDVRRAAAVIVAFDERIGFHIAQAAHQRAAADGMKRRQKRGRALWPLRQIAHDKHRPLVSDQL